MQMRAITYMVAREKRNKSSTEAVRSRTEKGKHLRFLASRTGQRTQKALLETTLKDQKKV
jgi:hypothetical protein